MLFVFQIFKISGIFVFMDDIDFIKGKILDLRDEIEFIKSQCKHNNSAVIESIQNEIKRLERDIQFIIILEMQLKP